mmetsp:Transcript_123107/g.213560  ORF Transcript_123107/g.213560 Transcript_123107/m.213560 type:complete len:101 (-) Transcript_123107:198-500(-)
MAAHGIPKDYHILSFVLALAVCSVALVAWVKAGNAGFVSETKWGKIYYPLWVAASYSAGAVSGDLIKDHVEILATLLHVSALLRIATFLDKLFFPNFKWF